MNARIIIIFFFPIFAIAQAPQKINFQSILRNSSGEVIGNSSVSLKISILSGSINSSSVYSEMHAKTTDASGLISLQIGNGTVISGIFANIDWGGASHFIKLEADFSGGSNYVVLGTQELMSVPYALYATKTDTSTLNLTSRFETKLTKTDTVSLSNRIDDKLTKTDTASLSNRIDLKLTKTDTASLSNRIDLKLTKTDTASLSNRIDLKLTKTDTVSLSNRIDDKLTKTDTASLSNRIDAKLNRSDFPNGTNAGNILYWNGTNWVNLAPGYDGQVLMMSSGSLRWGNVVPGVPTSVTAVRGYSQASVAFVAPTNNGGSSITGYTVSSSPGNFTETGVTSPINVTGLTNGTSYTFTVVATNIMGNSSASVASNEVTPGLVVPGPPTSVVAIAGNTSAGVSFVTPTNNGGSSITSYTVTSNPGNISVSGTTSPIGVTGLTNGTAYTFAVVATNALGSSVASSSSTAVTPNPNTVCPTSTITDIDGNTYLTVSIINQCWMSENLKTSRYSNGVSIPIVTDATAWVSLATGGRSWYDNDSTTYENPYGNLYNWYAVADNGGLCPNGWHVPTDAEWTTLTNYLGGVNVAGGKMKSTGTTYWNSPNTGATNESGFSVFPAGLRYGLDGSGSFFSIKNIAFFWSASEFNNSLAWYRSLYNYNGNVDRYNNTAKSYGASVRCLRD